MCAARATRGDVYLGRLQHSLHRTNLNCSCDSIHWRKSLRTQWSCHMLQNCSGTSWLGIMLCFINESALVFSWRDGPALGSNREAAVLISHKALQCCWWGQIHINVSNLHTQQNGLKNVVIKYTGHARALGEPVYKSTDPNTRCGRTDNPPRAWNYLSVLWRWMESGKVGLGSG